MNIDMGGTYGNLRPAFAGVNLFGMGGATY